MAGLEFLGGFRGGNVPPTPPRGFGVPGVQVPEGMDDQTAAMLLTQQQGAQIITEKDVRKAEGILQYYKDCKANLEERIVQDELWYQVRHWEAIRRTDGAKKLGELPNPSSAWLFNTIANKHADAMDNYPEPLALPRERSDEESARMISSVLPVVLEANDYEQTYSDNSYVKEKHGTGAYGVFWNTEKENGLGDIDIRKLDLLKIFWEPGITNIQDSRNLFIVDLVDEDILDQQYPEHAGKMKGGTTFDVKQYIFDDTVDITGKCVVVDWYYKVKSPDGRTLLHYVKFCGGELLYASQNDPACADGFYEHGMYPVVFDVMFPEEGTPVGFGFVAICKDPQLYIDKLGGNILENSMMGTKKRFFVSDSTNINEDELKDWNNPIVHVAGTLDDTRIQELVVRPLDGIYANVLQMKIEEMKDTSSNRDVNSGGTGSGVTAAAAIAALQEAGNKVSRDMISASYRAHVQMCKMCVELMRQFYDEARAFRITAPNAAGGYDFIQFSNAGFRDQLVGQDADGTPLYRRPVFDIKIRAQKRNPFSRMEQNERAKELYGMGFFNPENAQSALMCLEMMDFEGVDKVREKVQEGQTLYNVVQQLMQENMALKAAMGIAAPMPGMGGGQNAPAPQGGGSNADAQMNAAKANMTSYGQRLAKRSTPDMNGG